MAGCTAEGADVEGGRLTQAGYDAMPVLTLEPEQLFCADREDPPCQFANVSIIAAGPDGRLAMADGWGELRQFDSHGTFVRAIGRRGGGPGEYQMVMAAAYDSAGTLSVFQQGSRRVVRFDSTGAPLGTWTAPGVPGMLDVRMLRDRALYFVLPGAAAVGDTVEARVLSIGAPGTDTTALARFSLPALAQGDGTYIPFQPPFTVLPVRLWAVTPDGAVYMADRTRLRIDRVDGVRRTVVEGDVAPQPVSAAEVDAERERSLRVSPGIPTVAAEAMRRRAEAALAAAPSAQPLIDQLVALDDGTLWAREGASAEADSVRWNAFAPDGRPIGRLMLPAKARLMAGTRERLLLVTHDAFDVPVVGWYAVRGGAANR
jgi:hypothetical protein